MSEKHYHEKAISVMTDIQQMYEHSCALVYSDDSEKIDFHLFWVKWYLKRLRESLVAFEEEI